MDEKRDPDINRENNIDAEPSASEQQGHQNVYTVGSGAEDNSYKGNYTPPENGPDYRNGEYSYTSKDQIPDYRYSYNNSQPTLPPQKKKKPHRGGLIALVLVAAVLLAALAGVGGAMLVRTFDRPDDDIADTDHNDPAPSHDNKGGDTSDNSSAIIVKNDDSVTVKTVKGHIGDENLTIPDVVALVRDSVVEIYTEVPTYNGRFLASGAGSGVIFSRTETGNKIFVITNNHVISGAKTITVRLSNGHKYVADLCGTDMSSDIAVISFEADKDENILTVEFGSSKGLVVGESVIAIGNPLGELGGTVTNGIISSLTRAVKVEGQSMQLLQTNAAVNPGNSGGGLFNMKGELIGIVNAKSGGQNIENIGFAIPIDTAYDIAKELMSYGYVTGRVDAGLSVIDVTDTYSAFYYGVSSLGVYVYDSKYSDEIQKGDRIVAVNGKEISTSGEFKSALSEYSVGDRVTIRLSRGGKQFDVKLKLHEYIPEKTDDNK